MPEISTETTPTAAALEWVPIPAEIVRLGGSALVAWARIAAAGQVDPYDPSRITSTVGLADLDLTDTTARNAVHRLESTGLVIVDRAPGKASTYTLTRGDRWAQLPTTLVDLDAGPMAAYCSLFLSGTFESARRNTTVRRLASWLGAGLRTVRRWIAELVASGALARHGDYAYTLTPPPQPPQELHPNLHPNSSNDTTIQHRAGEKPTTPDVKAVDQRNQAVLQAGVEADFERIERRHVVEEDERRCKPDGHEQGHRERQREHDGQNHAAKGQPDPGWMAHQQAAGMGAAAEQESDNQDDQQGHHVECAEHEQIGGVLLETDKQIGDFKRLHV